MRLTIRYPRLLRFAALTTFCFTFVLLACYKYVVYAPDYTAFVEFDARAVSTATGHGPDDRLVLFHQVKGVGFNNQLQEILILEHTARMAGRVYVYQDVSWQPRGKTGFVPLGIFSDSLVAAPRRSERQFREECASVHSVSLLPEWDEKLYSKTVRVLKEDAARCVHVTDWLTRWRYLDSDAALALWPDFKASVQSFRWSPALLSAVDRIGRHLGIEHADKTIAVHIRRGDFSYHCHDLARGQHRFNLWNRLPRLPDPLEPGAGGAYNTTRAVERCYPSLEAVVAKILAARQDADTVYIMHDLNWSSPGTYVFIHQLRTALARAKPRDGGSPLLTRIVDTSQMKGALRWAESDLAVAVDLELARRAKVFVGNGFSSFSSDVTMLRLADGKAENTIRFW
ncbi:hypothetical protein AURDEDRAFT_115588 [Auricularia subglabra TFB-10046 SS5]|nr:hypothetical protein AURDEDRAFT_115588 [Auricularia subglabra TFB-10046 SS5]